MYVFLLRIFLGCLSFLYYLEEFGLQPRPLTSKSQNGWSILMFEKNTIICSILMSETPLQPSDATRLHRTCLYAFDLSVQQISIQHHNLLIDEAHKFRFFQLLRVRYA